MFPYCSSSNNRQLLLSIVLLFLLAGIVRSQDSSKQKQVMILCPTENCGFAIQSYANEEPKMIIKTHLMSAHNKILSDEEIISLIKLNGYKTNDSKIKVIDCPFGDVFKLWSHDEKEIYFWFGSHSKIVHKKELTDAEVKKLIKHSIDK